MKVPKKGPKEMSLAVVMQYGDGFRMGQEDMQNNWFDLTEVEMSFRECETEYEKGLQEAFWNGYVDGGQAFLEGVRL